MTNEFSGEESYPPLRRSLTELLFSAVLFQGRHWGLKASTSPCSMPSYPHCGLLLLLMQRKNCCPDCPHAFPWHRICELLSRKQAVLVLWATQSYFSFQSVSTLACAWLGSVRESYRSFLAGLQQSFTISVSPYSASLPTSCLPVVVGLLWSVRCLSLPPPVYEEAFLFLWVAALPCVIPFSLLPAPLPQSEAFWWLVIFLWTVQW